MERIKFQWKMMKTEKNYSKITKCHDFHKELISKVMISISIVGNTADLAKMFLEQVSRKYKVRILNPEIGVWFWL